MFKIVKEQVQQSAKNKDLLADYIDAYQDLMFTELVMNQNNRELYETEKQEFWDSLKQRTISGEFLMSANGKYVERKSIPEQLAHLESLLEGYHVDEIKQIAESYRKRKAQWDAEGAARKDAKEQPNENQSDDPNALRPEYANSAFYKLAHTEDRIKRLETNIENIQRRLDKTPTNQSKALLNQLEDQTKALNTARKEFAELQIECSENLQTIDCEGLPIVRKPAHLKAV